MALLWFFDPAREAENAKWEAEVINDLEVREQIGAYVAVKLSVSVKVAATGENSQETLLLRHPAFKEMLHQPGLAIIDMSDEQSPHFRHVVSVHPFNRGPISCGGLAAMLNLPNGSLTQRTLIWAVRTQGQNPQSAWGNLSPLLASEAESHCRHQASINLQGHHDWDRRFQSINSRLGTGMTSREVCAESWPGQHLVEAAIECVHSWRQSSGHWQAVSGKHDAYGFDMKLGTRGVWYATGIFGDRR